eukprot:GILJ01019851.1.p1 GENE.GILJ01019851.1~~GILJ01019851.1.p1  ORF type:complete len:1409 (-),score=187.18 GILJ01019851.1:37-3678(-)
MMGLTECQHTIIGDASLRGISGGQQKRVTLAEMLITNARVFCLDEISTGLDSAATLDIMASLRVWCKSFGGSIVATLLQPPPEVFALFDNVILLREGVMVYSGPRVQLSDHFAAYGIDCPDDQDQADFLVDFLSAPRAVYFRNIRQGDRIAQLHHHPVHARSDSTHSQTESTIESRGGRFSHDPPLTTSALRSVFEKSSYFISNEDVSSTAAEPFQTAESVKSVSPFLYKQFYQTFSHSLFYHTRLMISRQAKIMWRAKSIYYYRLLKDFLLGLVIGSLFWQRDRSDYSARVALALSAATEMSFSNMSEVPFSCHAKGVFSKQLDAGFSPAFSYALSVVLVHMPLAAVECLLFVVPVYWMTGFIDTADRFFFFLLTVFVFNLVMSALFRCIAYGTGKPDVGQVLVEPVVYLMVLTAGFLLTYHKIPNFMIWLYWISPFSWAVRSISLNEFNDAAYDGSVTVNGQRTGDSYLSSWQIQTDSAWKWAGVGVLFGYFLFLAALSAVLIGTKRKWLAIGTKRQDSITIGSRIVSNQNAAPESQQPQQQQGNLTTTLTVAKINETTTQTVDQQDGDTNTLDDIRLSVSNASSVLPFQPMNLVWRDLKYYVTVKNIDDKSGKTGTVRKPLLSGVNGFSKPGTLTALMGSSGAGKTTLMDVIAGRKTAGTVEGDILVNGRLMKRRRFNRLMGYVEQTDIHMTNATVKEALHFSARLRLPRSVTDTQRIRFVEEVMDILELTQLSNRVLGDIHTPGLSPGELKRVTIGVELVANPTFLFLDEPTSGLDSRAALTVMRAIKRIALTQRSILCTIHQPSAEIFYLFDRLLLLKSGGLEVYFGNLGESSKDFVDYFESTPVPEGYVKPVLPLHTNPADWMLDVIGAGTVEKRPVANFASIYLNSELRRANIKEIELLIQNPETGFDIVQDSNSTIKGRYAASYTVQLKTVLYRLFTDYWRNTSYNLVRFLIMLGAGIVFGLLWLQVDDSDQPGVNSKLAAIFMSTYFCSLFLSAAVLPVIYRYRTVFYRERSSNTYAPWIFAICLGIVELPYIFGCCVLFTLPYYFLVGFQSSGTLFWQYTFALYLVCVAITYAGQVWAVFISNMSLCKIPQCFMFDFMYNFGGVFVLAKDIPTPWKWMYYINPVPKGLVAAGLNEYECVSNCPSIIQQTGAGVSTVSRSDYVSTYLEASYGDYWNQIGWLILTCAILHFLFIVCLQKINHVKR